MKNLATLPLASESSTRLRLRPGNAIPDTRRLQAWLGHIKHIERHTELVANRFNNVRSENFSQREPS